MYTLSFAHRSARTPRVALLSAFFALVACDKASDNTPDTTSQDNESTSTAADDSQTGTASGDDSSTATGTGDPSAQIGGFVLTLVAPQPATDEQPAKDGYTALLGKIYDGATPSSIIWEQKESDGECQLLLPRVPVCATPCGGTALCVEDNVCQDFPSAQSVGTVTVEGLAVAGNKAPFDLLFVANAYQVPGDVHLDYPPFRAGDDVKVVASGGFTPAFEIHAPGIAALDVAPTPFELKRDTALTLQWTAGRADSTIEVRLDISHHGGSKGKIVCSGVDDGELAISAALATQLLDLGVAGFPTIIIERGAHGQAELAQGHVALELKSTVEREVIIEGVVSCNEDGDCPQGMTCQKDLTCRA